MRKESIRQRKIADLLKNELASIFIRLGFEIHPGIMFTIMKVRVSQDLSYAKVYVSIFPIKDKEKVLESINSTKGKIKHKLSFILKRQLRKLPDLSFYLDDSNEYFENIDRILKGDVDNPIK